MAAADSFDAGECCDFGEKPVEVGDLAGVGIAFVGQRDVEVYGVRGVETGIDVKDVDHAADEQSRADEKSESESGLRDDERVMKAVAMTARRLG